MTHHKSGFEIPDEFDGKPTEYKLGDGLLHASILGRMVYSFGFLSGISSGGLGFLIPAMMEYRAMREAEDNALKAMGDIVRSKYPDAQFQHYEGPNMTELMRQQPDYPDAYKAAISQTPALGEGALPPTVPMQPVAMPRPRLMPPPTVNWPQTQPQGAEWGEAVPPAFTWPPAEASTAYAPGELPVKQLVAEPPVVTAPMPAPHPSLLPQAALAMQAMRNQYISA